MQMNEDGDSDGGSSSSESEDEKIAAENDKIKKAIEDLQQQIDKNNDGTTGQAGLLGIQGDLIGGLSIANDQSVS